MPIERPTTTYIAEAFAIDDEVRLTVHRKMQDLTPEEAQELGLELLAAAVEADVNRLPDDERDRLGRVTVDHLNERLRALTTTERTI